MSARCRCNLYLKNIIMFDLICGYANELMLVQLLNHAVDSWCSDAQDPRWSCCPCSEVVSWSLSLYHGLGSKL
jgi:hypothetical protein